MNEKIEVVYPSDDEIYEQVNFIVSHSSPKKWTITRDMKEYSQSLYSVRIYVMMRTFYKSTYKSFDIRYIFQNYLEVIVFGLMLVFNLLIPSTS